MASMKDLFQAADWKKEKHVPVIESPDSVKKGEAFQVSVSVGKEIPHPNKTEHHIRWIAVFFHPEGAKFPYQVGRIELAAHGEGADGPDTGTVYTNPNVSFTMKTDKPGTLFASSYCNIHGLWEGSKTLKVV
jgi:superoxide reductase